MGYHYWGYVRTTTIRTQAVDSKNDGGGRDE